jgi:hypothetical protein
MKRFGSPVDVHVDEAVKMVSTAGIYVDHAKRKLAKKGACRAALDSIATVFALSGEAEAHAASAGRSVPGVKGIAADGEMLMSRFKKVCVIK